MKRSWDVLVYRTSAPLGAPPETYVFEIPDGRSPAADRPEVLVQGAAVVVKRGAGEGEVVVPLERVDRIEVHLNKGGGQ